MSGRRALWYAALVALALRLALLLMRGDYIVYDEGYYLLLSRSLVSGHGFTLNGLPHVALSPLQPVLVAALSLVGIPDLLASRLLGAACGALLVFPVAALARRAGGERVAVPAAAFTAVLPALMSFIPFFPGRSWNLYFGSEPLFLLLAFWAVACAARAEGGSWRWWVASGVLLGLAYLTRLEGAVLAGTALLVLAARLVMMRARGGAWLRLTLGVAAGVLVAGPYLLYLRHELGRWAISGRVQAAQAGAAEAPTAAQGARTGGQVVGAFVWQGAPDAFLRSLYALDAGGTRMASQYWGVRRESAAPAAAAGLPAAAAPPSAPPGDAARAAPVTRGPVRVWWEGMTAVVPWWFLAIALAGLAFASSAALVWVFPLAVCSLLPSLLTYVEPRSLLPLAPLAAIYAAVAVTKAGARLAERLPAPAAVALPTLVTLGLVWPAVRDGARAWSEATPLQQVATARRAVGEYLGQHLPPGAVVMSWHPAIAVWANREWRVLPYDSFARIAAYAAHERVSAVVFSRFEPSPLRQPPRAFTVVIPGPGPVDSVRVQLTPVDETPLLFVGRIAAPTAP